MPTCQFVAVAGPTGSGKSELAIRIAEAFDGEVINCDSLQVYRYFNIGAAKVPESDRRGIPHHLIDVLEPDALFTAGDYARHARACLDDIAGRGRLPVVAGGTGFYLRALIDGLVESPPRDETVRARLARREQRRPGSLARILSRLDPKAGAAIHPNDTPKLIRALEVILLSGRRLSDAYAARRGALEGWRHLLIGLNPPRDLLYARINARAKEMFAAGLTDEVRSILERGFPRTVKPFDSLGYKQALQLLDGEIDEEQAVESTARATRHYAKRQLTWFRADPRVVWRTGFGADTNVQHEVLDSIAEFLRSGC